MQNLQDRLNALRLSLLQTMYEWDLQAMKEQKQREQEAWLTSQADYDMGLGGLPPHEREEIISCWMAEEKAIQEAMK